MFKFKNIMFGLCVSLFLFSPVQAQEGRVTEEPEYADENTGQTITIRGRYFSESDIDATGSNITISESSFKYWYEYKFMDVLPVEFKFWYDHVEIDDNDPVMLPSHLESLLVGVGTKLPVPFIESDHHFMGIDIHPQLNTDDGQWESSAFRIGTRIYWIYRRDENFIVFAGMFYTPDYERQVAPLMGFIYKPNDRLSFNFSSTNPTISYQVTEQTNILWDFNLTYREYEVTRNGQDGVVLQYQNYSTGIALEHEWTDHLQTTLGVGAVFARKLEYADDNGKVVPETGLYTEFRITANF